MDGIINPALAGYLRSGRIPHGFLFYGGEETLNAAKLLSAVYLCPACGAGLGNDSIVGSVEPCGICASCVKAENKSHPDIVMAKESMPDGKYKAEPLRKLITDGYLRPNDGEMRVFIFEDLHEMSPVCQNALLKFIEEPPEFNRFIFTAKTTSGILETIISRLVRVDFEVGHNYENEDEAVRTAVKRITDGLTEKDEYKVAAAFRALDDRDKQKTALELIASVMRDVMVYKNGGDNLVSFYKEGARAAAKTATNKGLVAVLEVINEYAEKTLFNPNVRLASAVYSSAVYDAFNRIS